MTKHESEVKFLYRKLIQFHNGESWEDVSEYDSKCKDSLSLCRADFNEYVTSRSGLYRIIDRRVKRVWEFAQLYAESINPILKVETVYKIYQTETQGQSWIFNIFVNDEVPDIFTGYSDLSALLKLKNLKIKGS